MGSCVDVCQAFASVLKASVVLLNATGDSCDCGFDLKKDIHSRVKAAPARKHAPASTRGSA